MGTPAGAERPALPGFSQIVEASTEDVDELGHISNLVYVRWLQEIARAHSRALGWSHEAYLRLGAVFVVRRHEIDYLAPVYAGDSIRLTTSIKSWSGATCVRATEFARIADGRAVARGATLWAMVSTTTGRPRRVPPEILESFMTARAPLSPVFAFEEAEIGPDLDLVPLAARRALDHAGLKLSLEGWRSLRPADRRRIAEVGAAEQVSVAAVTALVAQASPAAAAMAPAEDPDPRALPEGLAGAALPLARWEHLRPIERFALAHTCKRAARRGDPSILEEALAEIAGPPPRA